jgi:tetratricopeptide (TPR) repeat protein
VILRSACLTAAALAAGVLVPGFARADRLAEAEREAGLLEERLRRVEELALRHDESEAARASRKFSDGETAYLLGDWTSAAFLIGEALDEPSFQAGSQHATAIFYLGDALRKRGDCGVARPILEAYLSGGAPEHRGEALGAAVDCAMKEGRSDEVQALLAEAGRTFAGNLPAELRYVAAKALFQRTDLPPADRFEQAWAAFAAVPPPYLHQAAYFQGVLQLERGDLAAAGARFEACAAIEPKDGRQREAQDLCFLAMARVQAERGDLAAALDWYARLPVESPHFDEALYETAWTYSRAGHLEAALRTAETVAELAPDSPLAPGATLLQAHLLLRLGRYDEATDTYQRLVDQLGQVRDDLDAILTQHEDPVRYLTDLVARQGRAFDVATVLPPVAVRRASARPDYARALRLAGDLEDGRRDVAEATAMADRIEAVLTRGSGLDGFPLLQEGYTSAQAVENAAAVLQGAAASAAVAAGASALDPAARDELDRVHAERVILEARLDDLPRTAEAAVARLDRLRTRLDEVDRAVFKLGFVAESSDAIIAGAELWIEAHRHELRADETQRRELQDELRTHRGMVDEYEAELRRLRQEIALARDAAAGTDALSEEARLRAEYVDLLARERELLAAARGRVGGPALARLERASKLSDRLAAVSARALALGERLEAEASRRAEALRARVALERAALSEQIAALDIVQGEASDEVGRIAYHAFGEVRRELYGLVLEGDVGLTDVVWVRKRDRMEQIQQLSLRKADELRALEERYRRVLKEEE